MTAKQAEAIIYEEIPEGTRGVSLLKIYSDGGIGLGLGSIRASLSRLMQDGKIKRRRDGSSRRLGRYRYFRT